jgi:hypothetical protein
MKRERRHIRAEHNFIRVAIHKRSESNARIIEQLIGLVAGRVIPVRVRVVVFEVVAYGLDYLFGHLRPARTIEVGDTPATVFAVERRERTADLLHLHLKSLVMMNSGAPSKS